MDEELKSIKDQAEKDIALHKHDIMIAEMEQKEKEREAKRLAAIEAAKKEEAE